MFSQANSQEGEERGRGAFLAAPLPRGWLWLVLGAGIALRLLFIFRFPILTPDSLVYGDIAKNWLLHGVYGLSEAAGPAPTYIRLPGYPGFLAAVFAVAGVDHYNAVRFAQLAIDIATCWVAADLARRVASRAAAGAAFALYALCPFVANYVAAPLTETAAIFAAAVALDCAAAGLDALRSAGEDGGRRSKLRLYGAWAGCGVATALGILLRPDGGLVLIAIGAYLLYWGARHGAWRRAALAGCIIAAIALAPLAPWSARNWRVLDRFQPLAPPSANAPGEFVAAGFQRWEQTWQVDYASVVDVGFRVDGEAIDFEALPRWACDSPAQCERTRELFDQYNAGLAVTPTLDAGFAALAEERVRSAPVRTRLLLPAARALDMWLRPRTELLPVDAHFWDLEQGWTDVSVALLLGILNLMLIALAVAGGARTRIRFAGLLLGFCALRTVLVTALQSPEPRYMLECYPVVMALAGAAVARWKKAGAAA